MDGVLFDSIKFVNDYFLRIYPTSTSKDWDEALSGNFHEGLEKIRRDHMLIKETPEEEKARKEKYAIDKGNLPMYPGIVELLNTLHDLGYILVINTSALEVNCFPLLERSNVARFFDFVATAETSKSKIEKFKIIQDRYKAEKGDMLFITDTLGDVREAEAAEILTVAVTWGAHDASYFKHDVHKNVVAIADSVEELENFFKSFLL